MIRSSIGSSQIIMEVLILMINHLILGSQLVIRQTINNLIRQTVIILSINKMIRSSSQMKRMKIKSYSSKILIMKIRIKIRIQSNKTTMIKRSNKKTTIMIKRSNKTIIMIRIQSNKTIIMIKRSNKMIKTRMINNNNGLTFNNRIFLMMMLLNRKMVLNKILIRTSYQMFQLINLIKISILLLQDTSIKCL